MFVQILNIIGSAVFEMCDCKSFGFQQDRSALKDYAWKSIEVNEKAIDNNRYRCYKALTFSMPATQSYHSVKRIIK